MKGARVHGRGVSPPGAWTRHRIVLRGRVRTLATLEGISRAGRNRHTVPLVHSRPAGTAAFIPSIQLMGDVCDRTITAELPNRVATTIGARSTGRGIRLDLFCALTPRIHSSKCLLLMQERVMSLPHSPHGIVSFRHPSSAACSPPIISKRNMTALTLRVGFTALLMGLTALLSTLLHSPASADESIQRRRDGTVIPVCVGWDPEHSRFGTPRLTGFDGQRQISEYLCPKGFGIFSGELPLGPDRAGRMIPVIGDCCPLPPDALLDEPYTEHAVECPDDQIIIGGRMEKVGWDPWWEQTFFIRCARINSARYELGNPTAAVRAGPTMSYSSELFMSIVGMSTERVSYLQIPAGVRYGIGRLSATEWKAEVCVGFPYGSLAVGKHGKQCNEQSYRQLLYRGVDGDPPAGTPVELFARCEAIEDPLSPSPRCITGGGGAN